MTDWKEYKLGDLCDVKGGKRLPKGELLVSYDTGHPYIRVTDLGNKWISKDRLLFVEPHTQKGIARYTVNSGDVILSIVGSIGFVGRIAKSLDKANLTENCVKFLINPKELDDDYLYYFLTSRIGQDEIDKGVVGSTQPKLPLYNIKGINIKLPPLPEQQAIAEVLSSLDDKIDLLHCQNKTLEVLAKTLFRQWFVEEAEENWGDGFVTDLIDLNPKRSLRKETIAPYLEMSNLSNELYHPHDWYDRIFTSGTKFINGDTLLARITPCLENGKTAYVDFLKDDEVGWGSTEFIVMRAKPPLHPFFSYILARHSDFRSFAIGCMVGSSGRQRADVENLATYEMKLPPANVINRFNEYIEPSLQKMKINNNQIRTLTTLRDTLLPKLMSGEVRVNQ